MRNYKQNEDPLKIQITLESHKELGDGRYVFHGKIPVKIFSEHRTEPYFLYESYDVYASKNVFKKFESFRDQYIGCMWGYGAEVVATLDLYEVALKHNAYPVSYFLELLDVEPFTDGVQSLFIEKAIR